MKKVFIDGSAGTTGLRIYERLGKRNDIELLSLPEELRKNSEERKRMLNIADIAFLCLPDDAAREAVAMTGEDTVIIDTSTAHRTLEGWAYGFPELSPDFCHRISSGNRIAVPGCHASGFIALVRPLTESGLLPQDIHLTCHSLTGYSGGGKKMIAEYEDGGRSPLFDAPRAYALSCEHKHLKEMKAITGIKEAPIFCPIVSDYYSGMLVTVPLFASDIRCGGSAEDIKKVYRELYTGSIVKYTDDPSENGLLSAGALSGSDRMEISVFGNGERILLTARYDNLGKGASGAAVECMNYVLGASPESGLVL